ncbi:alpha/beta fold hydrolase [Legionella dresdenensis]|uniref:Pimeloyl-[acyl-carrier protein] methyl ester esterase n=1 Tax=Legionella dresdenensis TaxID=450200 RepID=A0ABV8CBJ1_9GAMM
MNLSIKTLGNGKPLVFFHGWGFDHSIWLPLAEAIKDKFSVYLVDLPGFGQSSTMEWGDFKTMLLDRLPEKFSLVGWSMGGLYATRFALEESERVSHLINVASSPCFLKNDDWPGVERRMFENFYANLVSNPEAAAVEFVNLQLQNQIYQNTVHFLPSSEALKNGLKALAEWDLRDLLKHYQKPVSYVFGRLDSITPRATMLAMKKLFPSFDYALFRRAAHLPFLSHQNEFIEHIERFTA